MAPSPARSHHFQHVLDHLPKQLEKLLAARCCARKAHPPIPKAPGVYLFSENGRPVYVGQTRNLRQRLAAHMIPSSGQNTASFAFNIAKHKAGPMRAKPTREEIERLIKPLFTRAKERVSRMDVQFIEMDDPIERTVFELYAALHLGTEKYNSFETH